MKSTDSPPAAATEVEAPELNGQNSLLQFLPYARLLSTIERQIGLKSPCVEQLRTQEAERIFVSPLSSP